MLATCLPHLRARLPLTVCPGLPAPPGWQVPPHPTASLRCPSLCSAKGQSVRPALQCLFGSNIIKTKGCWGNGPRRKAGNKASLQRRRTSSGVGLRDGEGSGENKLCAGRERGDERREECRVLQVGEGRAGGKHPHLSGEPPGWPSPQAGPALYPGTGGLISAVCITHRSNSPFSPHQGQPPAEAPSRRSHQSNQPLLKPAAITLGQQGGT